MSLSMLIITKYFHKCDLTIYKIRAISRHFNFIFENYWKPCYGYLVIYNEKLYPLIKNCKKVEINTRKSENLIKSDLEGVNSISISYLKNSDLNKLVSIKELAIFSSTNK